MTTVAWVPVVIAALGCAVLARWYVAGLRTVRRSAGGRRRYGWRPLALLAGVVLAVGLLLPPVDAAADGRLLTHMGQHMALVLVAAPLLALGAPGVPLLAGMPRRLRTRLVRLGRARPLAPFAAPAVAWVLQIGLMWAWHLPAFFDAAEESPLLHGVEHACFLVPAWLFWWHLAGPSRRRLRGPTAVFYVVGAMLPLAAIGALLTLAGAPLYPAQAAEASAAGVDPLRDQQLAGLVMWIPMDLGYLAVAAGLFLAWFRGLGEQVTRGRHAGVRSEPEGYLVADDPEGVSR